MTVTQAPAQQVRPLEELNLTWLKNNRALFVCDEDFATFRRHVEAHGFTDYYVVATKEYEHKIDDKRSEYHKVPRVFHVMNSLMGDVVTVEDSEIQKLPEIKDKATFRLPKIPWGLIERIVVFFKEVHRANNTESIVLFTYDPTVLGTDRAQEGWGIVVPDQENTIAHCRYEPTSVMEDKPDDAVIVGSCHSHPGMQAFKSSTDHHDQEGFDGLHITVGWPRNKTSVEFYIEMQMGGKHYTLNPDQVFDKMPEATVEDYPEIKDWMTKVTKEKSQWEKNRDAAQGGGGLGFGGGSSGTRTFDVPKTCPDIYANTVIVRLLEDEGNCPVCKNSLTKKLRDNLRCDNCCCYLIPPSMTVNELVAAKDKQLGAFNYELNESMDPPRPIRFWNRGKDNNNNFTQEVIDVYDPPKA